MYTHLFGLISPNPCVTESPCHRVSPSPRPYWLVDDIQAAVDTATGAGGFIAMSPTKIPGKGTFAIFIQGGIDHGLWQL